MALRFEDLRVRDGQLIDRDFFNRRYRLIAEALSSLGGDVDRIDGVVDNLFVLGLSRVDEVLGPALATAQAAAENGFLVATSAQELTLTVGLETTIAVDDTPARALFTPTPHVILTREGGASDDWAIFSVDSYNRTNGGLAGTVLAINGALDGTAHTDWTIAASAGVSATILQAAGDVANALATAQSAAAQADQAAQDALEVIANGPVSSVNGLTGIVTFGISDIPNLAETLGGKAASSHGHAIGDVSDLQTALDAKADAAATQTALDAKANAADLNEIDGGTY